MRDKRNICQDAKTVAVTRCSFRLGKMRSFGRSFHFSVEMFFDIAVHCSQRERQRHSSRVLTCPSHSVIRAEIIFFSSFSTSTSRRLFSRRKQMIGPRLTRLFHHLHRPSSMCTGAPDYSLSVSPACIIIIATKTMPSPDPMKRR
jgi:hypothetical protein